MDELSEPAGNLNQPRFLGKTLNFLTRIPNKKESKGVRQTLGVDVSPLLPDDISPGLLFRIWDDK